MPRLSRIFLSKSAEEEGQLSGVRTLFTKQDNSHRTETGLAGEEEEQKEKSAGEGGASRNLGEQVEEKVTAEHPIDTNMAGRLVTPKSHVCQGL